MHFQEKVRDLRTRVSVAKAKAGAGHAGGAAAGSGGPAAKKAKHGLPALEVPKSDLSLALLATLVPEHCKVAESHKSKAWRAWWVGPKSHLGNRARAWGQWGHHGSGVELLKCVWKMHLEDGGAPCTIVGLDLH